MFKTRLGKFTFIALIILAVVSQTIGARHIYGQSLLSSCILS